MEGHRIHCIAGMASEVRELAGMEFGKVLVEVLAGQETVPVYQIRGVVCNSFGNLCVGEDNCFEDQIYHSNSQPTAEWDMRYHQLKTADKELVKIRRVDHKCS